MARTRLLVALAVAWCSIATTAQAGCPRGMVWGGHKCEWRNLCPGGRPVQGGLCRDGRPPTVRPPGGPPSGPPPQGPILVKPIYPPVQASRPCESLTVFDLRQDQNAKQKQGIFGRMVQSRRLLIVGGNAGELAARYFKEAEDSGRHIDLRKLEIVLFKENGEQRTLLGGDQVRMSVGQLLAGLTWEQVWEAKLGPLESAQRFDAEEQARALKADLRCGTENNQ